MAKKETENNSAELEALVEDLPGEVILDLNVNPEDDDKIPLDPDSGLDPEQLEKELEGLKDLVQDEIDKMLQKNPDAEWSEIVKEAKEEKAHRGEHRGKPCECCGENEVDDDEVYCADCLETMRHYPFEWWKFFIPVLTVVLVVLSFSFFAISWSVYSETVAAQKLVKEGKLLSALKAYDNINAEIKVTDKNYGSKYLWNQVKIYDAIGIDEYEALDSFIDTYYAGTAINKKSNKKVKAIKEKITEYSSIYESLEIAMSGAETYTEFETAFDEAIKGKGYEPAFVYYYKYYAATTYGESTEKQLEILDKIKAEAPEYKTLYLPLMAEVALADKRYDDMISYSNEIAQINQESAYAWWYKIVAYRLQGNTAKASNACTEALKANSSNSLINYQMAIVCLLQGKTETALSYASSAYEYADTLNAFISASSLYSLCTQLEGDTKTNDSIISELESYGYALSDDVSAIVNGDKTIEDVFTKGTGDFSWE